VDAVNVTLVTALVALVPVSVGVAWSSITFARRKTLFSFLQLVGAGCLVVVLTHVAEALHILPWMRWANLIAWVTTSICRARFSA